MGLGNVNTYTKEIIGLISSDPPSKNANARFTMVPLQTFDWSIMSSIRSLLVLNSDNFKMFSCTRNAKIIFEETHN